MGTSEKQQEMNIKASVRARGDQKNEGPRQTSAVGGTQLLTGHAG